MNKTDSPSEANTVGIAISFFAAVLIGIAAVLDRRNYDFGIVSPLIRSVVVFTMAFVLLYGLCKGPYTDFVFRRFRKIEITRDYTRWIFLLFAVTGLAWVLISFSSDIVIPSVAPAKVPPKGRSSQHRSPQSVPSTAAIPSYWPYIAWALLFGLLGVTGWALSQPDIPLEVEGDVTHEGKFCGKYRFDRNNWLYDRTNNKWISPENMRPFLTQRDCILLDENCWATIIKPVEATVGPSGKHDVEHGSYAVFSIIPDKQRVFITSGDGRWNPLIPKNDLVFKEKGRTMRLLEKVDPPSGSLIELGVDDCCWYNLGPDYLVVNQATQKLEPHEKDFCKYTGDSYLILKRQDAPDEPVVNISSNEKVWYNLGGKYKVVRTNSQTVDPDSTELIKFNADTCLLLKKQSAPEQNFHILTANDKGWFALGVGKYAVYEESKGILKERLEEYIKYEEDTCVLMRRQNSPAGSVVTINADEYAWFNLGGNYVAVKMDGTTTNLFSGTDFIKCDPSTYVLLRRNADLAASGNPQPHQKNLADDSQGLKTANMSDSATAAEHHSKEDLMDAVGVAEVFTDWRIKLVDELPTQLGRADGALINNLMHGEPFDVNIDRVIDSILEKATLEIDGKPARRVVGEIWQQYNTVYSPPPAENLANPYLRHRDLTNRVSIGEKASDTLKHLQLSTKVKVRGQVAKHREHVTDTYPGSTLFEIQLIIQDIKFASLDLLREGLERKVNELKTELETVLLPDQMNEFIQLMSSPAFAQLPKKTQEAIIEQFSSGASNAREAKSDIDSFRPSPSTNMPQLQSGASDAQLLNVVRSTYVIRDENEQQVNPDALSDALEKFKTASDDVSEEKFIEWLRTEKLWTFRSL